ncbi:MAG: L,D-transpeptidase [Trichlorobacter sp.]|jgi:hypothetical protein
MRFSRMRWTHRVVLIGFFTVLLVSFTVLRTPDAVDEPGASLLDKADEDLTRVEYPSLKGIRWHARFIRPQDSLESLYGKDWVWVARFNRIDRRHIYPGMTIKEPEDMATIRGYTPLPQEYAPARQRRKYLLLDVSEQWIGAYERGVLKFSMPAATGKAGSETPLGMFRIDARHLTHTSSLYKVAEEGDQYPMDNALRFFIDDKNVGYWIHARDLPGRPASHGCIGLFDEEMQQRVFETPKKPILLDSQKLYAWAAPDSEYGDDYGSHQELSNGPVLEVRGTLPQLLPPRH